MEARSVTSSNWVDLGAGLPQVGGDGVEPVGAARAHQDPCAAGSQGAGYTFADAAGGAGDQNDLVHDVLRCRTMMESKMDRGGGKRYCGDTGLSG
jgi:hypothetical protein